MFDERPQPMQFATNPQPGPGQSGDIHLSGEVADDFPRDSKKQTVVVVVVVLAVIALAIAVFSYMMRPKPKATGTIEEAYAVALPGDNVLATIKVNLQNVGGKPLYINEIRGVLTTADGKKFEDVAASAVDFDRYFRAFPDLRDHSLNPLRVETQVRPGEQARGSAIFGFPVTLDTFNARKSLSIVIQPYHGAVAPGGGDEPAVIITK